MDHLNFSKSCADPEKVARHRCPNCPAAFPMPSQLRAHLKGGRGCEIERHVADCRAKGYAVQQANFLETTPEPVFDVVLMNPPFYGRHYQKHVEHAKRFLKTGGELLAILPASARYCHEYVAPRDSWSNEWRDLPVASFAASGTNVPTGIYRWRASQ